MRVQIEEYPGQRDGLMIRCPKCGKENYAIMVARDKCAWCGYDPKLHSNLNWENRSTQGLTQDS